jgi:hypothetical protein
VNFSPSAMGGTAVGQGALAASANQYTPVFKSPAGDGSQPGLQGGNQQSQLLQQVMASLMQQQGATGGDIANVTNGNAIYGGQVGGNIGGAMNGAGAMGGNVGGDIGASMYSPGNMR